jgi:hypothetical protein
MLREEIQIFNLFDEFYFIQDEVKIETTKGNDTKNITQNEFTFTGTNKRKTVFVYNDINQLSDNDLLMLENLVNNGIGWPLQEIVLLNLEQNTFATIQKIKEFFTPTQIIFWGCDEFLVQNKIPLKLHEILRGKEINVLTVRNFSFYQSKEEKILLWNSIKNLFNLK